MKNRQISVFTFLILITITSCVSTKDYQQLEDKNEKLSNEVKEAEELINQQEKTINDLKSDTVSLSISKSTQEEAYTQLEENFYKLSDSYEQLQSDFESLPDPQPDQDNSMELEIQRRIIEEHQSDLNNLKKQEVKSDIDRAELTYYCPREVKEGAEFSLAVVISKVLGRKKLEDTLVKRMRFSDIELSEKEITDFITSHGIKIGDSISVKIEFDEEDFKIIVPETRKIRKIGEELEEWNWRLKAIGPGDHEITVIIENLESEKWKRDVPIKSFPINVSVDTRSYFYKLWQFVQEKPEWPIATIILPVISFFAGQWKERRKSNQA